MDSASAAAKPRRELRLSYLAPPPAKLTSKGRLRASVKDDEVLWALGEYHGQLYRETLAARLRAGSAFGKQDLATQVRLLTTKLHSSFAGTIALDVRDEYALAKRNAYDHRDKLRRHLKEACARTEVLRLRRDGKEIPGQLEQVKVPKGLTLEGALRSVANKERKLRQVEQELETGHFSICKGTARLLKARMHLEQSRFADEEEWRRQWQADRLYLAAYGRARARWGNYAIVVDPQGAIEIALPKDPRFQQYDNTGRGRYHLDAQIEFPYKAEGWKAAVTGGESVYYEFSFDPRIGRNGKSGEGRWYLSTTVNYPEPEAALAQSLDEAKVAGVAAIDLNDKLLACRLVDAYGNPSGKIYDIDLGRHSWDDLSSETRETILGQELALLCAWATSCGVKALAVEDLDFADLRGKRRNKVTNRKLHGIPTAIFRHLLVSIAARHGLRVIACDPAYTTIDGKSYWADCGPSSQDFKLSRHQAAAICIGRRSLALPLRRRRRRPTGGSKQASLERPGVGEGGKRSGTIQSSPERVEQPPGSGQRSNTSRVRPTRRTTGPTRGARRSELDPQVALRGTGYLVLPQQPQQPQAARLLRPLSALS